MADMVPNSVAFATGHTSDIIVLEGERVRIQILNSDGTEKTLLTDQTVPADKQAKLAVWMSATLSAA